MICDGSQMCVHAKERASCTVCGGSRLCEHGITKSYCGPCGGSQICIHDKRKTYCFVCDGKNLCKSSWCDTIGNKKYKGYCLFCTLHLFPDMKTSRNYRTKEREVVVRVKKQFPDVTWIWDKTVSDGCSKRRPDLLLDMGSHVILVEIDENRHQYYTCSCESTRIMEISSDVGNRPMVVIRFNPDAYVTHDGIQNPSCWRINAYGITVLVKKRISEWDMRIDSLHSQISYWLNNVPEKNIEVIELFY